MYKVNIQSQKFPKTVSLPSQFQISKAKLAWAALTTGKPDKAATKRHTGFSQHEMLFRWNLVLASINLQRKDKYLENSVLFNDMDPSEKGGLNFFLGMAFGKIAAQELLDVPWLAHYSWYKKTKQISWQPSRSTADLIGKQTSTGNYVVLEAKGRNGSQYKDALDKAVTQAKQNYVVNGKSCSLHIGSVLYREKDTNRLAMIWEDPEPTRKDGTLELKMDRDFWREYYAAAFDFLDLQESSPKISKTKFGFEIKLADPLKRLRGNIDASEKDFNDSVEELKLWSGDRRERIQTEPLENWNGDGIIVKVRG